MNQLLQDLFEGLKKASLASKATTVLVAAALVALGIGAGVLSSRPHFELLYSGMNARESAQVQRALGEGGIRFEASQPPGPFSIYVDRDERYAAQNLVASSGALERAPSGIPGGDSGLSTVFMSAGERAQMVRKREWEETEGMLEELDFVLKAKVRSSTPSSSPFGPKEPVTASVTLQLAGASPLADEQAESVANLVRFGLGVEREHLVITDQRGRPVFDGAERARNGNEVGDWIEFQETHDRGLEERVNQVLAESFGDGRARVALRSEWNFDKVHTQSERTENTKALLSDSRRMSKTPHGAPAAGSAGGGAAGTASNLNQGTFGVDQAGVVGRGQDSGVVSDLFSETEDKRSEYAPSWITTETRRTTPILERLSVSLFLNEELEEQRAQLEEVVKAAVGFDPQRGDQLSSMPVSAVETLEEDAQGGEESTEGAPAEEVVEGGENPLVGKLIETAVEVAAALAFVFLLFRSLKGSPSRAKAAEAQAAAAGEEPPNPEVLARAKVDAMLIEDPEKVGEILSEWAREEAGARG